ncbi:hypothetical protein SDC9_121630 [bioreactor metagenome]|uniref:Uncharacterized protein n=1 Tax=bioreactor metagenome TaxID=1076179 RepID=A0A645CCJ6_9ZZZZ
MIDEALNNNHYVYFVPQEGSEQMVEFAYNGYQLTKIGSYQLEGYFFDIYNVSKE